MDPLLLVYVFSVSGKYIILMPELPYLKPGDHVIVETSRGKQLGQVAQLVENLDNRLKENGKRLNVWQRRVICC
jgi:hypothetical protein